MPMVPAGHGLLPLCSVRRQAPRCDHCTFPSLTPATPFLREVDGEDAEVPRGPFDSGLGVRIQVGRSPSPPVYVQELAGLCTRMQAGDPLPRRRLC